MKIEFLMENYTPASDLIAVVTCIVLQIVVYGVLNFSREDKFVYLKRSLTYIGTGSLLNIVFWYLCNHYNGMVWAVFLIRDLYHTCFLCCLFLYLLYIKAMFNVDAKITRFVSGLTRAFLLIAVIFDCCSPFTKFGFHKEGELWYDPLISPYNIFYIYAVVLMFFMLVVYYKRLIQSVQRCLLATEFVVAVIMAYGAYTNTNTFTGFTYLLPVFVVIVLLHSKPFDEKTGALSVVSFENYVNQEARKGELVDYLVLKMDMVAMTDIPEELGKVLNYFWRDLFKGAKLFSIEHDLFVLAVPRNAKNGNTEEKIRSMIVNDFPKYYAQYQFRYKILGLFNLDYIQDETDLEYIINYLLLTMNDNTIILTDDKRKEQLRLLRCIRKNLEDIETGNDLDDPRVLVYCQPIRNMRTGKYDTAEALMRLSLPDEGFIMPNLFIPLAENYGHIHALTRVMLNKVCKQIKALEDEGYVFKRISVNFAASEIRKEDFSEEVLGIIRKNGVNPAKIGIELTESQNESDFQIVKDKISELRKAGMTLYLDDVGTGYSNMDRIVRYDVDVVKFDRFFLLEAEKDEKVVQMMTHLSDAFRDLKYSLLYEGVETEENEQLCLKCGADYIQGFKYSKPIPMEELRGFFEKNIVYE